MTALLFLFCTLYLGCACFLYRCCAKSKLSSKKCFYLELCILFLSVYLSLYLSVLTPNGDSVYLITVLKNLTEKPLFGFYDRVGITYPPLLNYVYFLLGKLLALLDVPLDWSLRSFIFCVKLPGILCLFLMALLIYSTARARLSESERVPPLFLTLLNPGYLLVTCYICQVDALYSFFVLLTLFLIEKRRLKPACFSFAAGILFKFQAVFIAPVLLFAIIDQVLLHDFSWKRFFSHLLAGLSAIGCMLLSYLPFCFDFSTGTFSQNGFAHNLTSSVSGYGRASTNAYNFWTLIGFNLKRDSEMLGPFPCSGWGMFSIALLILLCSYFCLNSFGIRIFSPRSKVLCGNSKEKIHRNPCVPRQTSSNLYPLLAAFLVAGIFCFSVRMMSRYLYPAIVLLIFAWTLKPTKKRLLCTVAFSLAFFCNVWCDYMIYPYSSYHDGLVLPRIFSLCTILCFLGLTCTAADELPRDRAAA